MPKGRYTFGDGERAAARLALLAEVFAPTSREWLAQDPCAKASFDAEAIASMTASLDAIAAGDVDAPPVSAVVGQAVLRLRG